MTKLLFKQVQIGEYFTFTDNPQIWQKVGLKKIQKLNDINIIEHTKNTPVFLIGDMEKAIKSVKKIR